MKRRSFIKRSSAVSLPLLLNGFPLATANVLDNKPLDVMARRAADTGKIIVIIRLNGGNDGLNTVFPVEQWTKLINARNNILIPESSVLRIGHNDTAGLHPSMGGMRNLANQEMLTLIQGVSYPNPNFSHFRATDIWMSGSPSDVILETGWLGRALEHKYPGFPTGYPNADMPDPLAINIGSTLPFSLQGHDLNFGHSTTDPQSLMDIINEIAGPAPENDYGYELNFLRMMKDQSNVYSNSIRDAYLRTYQDTINYSTNALSQQLKIVARLINGGLRTPIYVVTHPRSFDTHEFQVDTGNKLTGTHAENLAILSEAITSFQQDMVRLDKAELVAGMTFSEFGRRIKSNDSFGTDHGVGAPVFFFGGALNQKADPGGTSAMRTKGMIGEAPVLPQQATVSDQIAMQFDYRQIYTTVMQDWLGLSKAEADAVLGGSFEKLPIFKDVEILPVELVTFEANLSGNTTLLNWETASELNNYKFEIERSHNHIDFKTVGTVKGHGTSNIPVSYQHTDRLEDSGTYYYRLKQIDYNGTFAYSDIVAVYFQQDVQLMVYPNPAQDFLIVQSGETKSGYMIQVYNTVGHLLLEQRLDLRSGQHRVDIGNLPKGTYFVSIYGQERMMTQQFVKH